MGYAGPQRDCPHCRAANFTIRSRCRHCGRPIPKDAAPVATDAMIPDDRGDGCRAIAERYCLGLLVSEAGEALQDTGNALRFGLDTPHLADLPETARDHRVLELGDVLAAVEFACLHGLFDRAGIEAARDRKLGKLCDPANRDHLGRPLAPRPIRLGGGTGGATCRYFGYSLRDGQAVILGANGDEAVEIVVPAERTDAFVAALREAFPPPRMSKAALDTVLVKAKAVLAEARAERALAAEPAGLTRPITMRRDASRAIVVFENDLGPFELGFDFDGARDLQRHLAAAFPNHAAA